MPVYSLTSHKKISENNKMALVNLLTDVHCSIMIAPEQFVHVLFSDGIPIREKNQLYIHANVRAGRSKDTINKLRETLTTECAKILQIAEDKVYINLLEIDAKWVMEGGYVMPGPGEEDEWMEKVTKALAKREKVATN
ncbi:MAG: hypothetical protein AAFR87_25890 [Bacteroidota bacterium]